MQFSKRSTKIHRKLSKVFKKLSDEMASIHKNARFYDAKSQKNVHESCQSIKIDKIDWTVSGYKLFIMDKNRKNRAILTNAPIEISVREQWKVLPKAQKEFYNTRAAEIRAKRPKK